MASVVDDQGLRERLTHKTPGSASQVGTTSAWRRVSSRPSNMRFSAKGDLLETIGVALWTIEDPKCGPTI